MMNIKVIRDYSGEEGEGPNKDVVAGRVLSVTEARGATLIANKLGQETDEKPDEAHLALIVSDQPIAAVQVFPSGGVTSVAPVNQVEREDGAHVLTSNTMPVVEETTVTSIEQPNTAPIAGTKTAATPANKKAREPGNKAVVPPETKSA